MDWVTSRKAEKGTIGELVTMVNAKQMSRLLRKKLATRAFVGMVRKVTETVEEREGKTQSDLYSSQL